MNEISRDAILADVTEVIRDIFDEYEGPVTPDLNAAKVPQWDSLAHVQLMVLLEKKFGIRFKMSEIQSFKNLGDVIASIENAQER